MTHDELEDLVLRLDDALTFVMKTMRIRATFASQLSGPDGQPLPGRVQEMTMLDAYNHALAEKAAESTPDPNVNKLIRES